MEVSAALVKSCYFAKRWTLRPVDHERSSGEPGRMSIDLRDHLAGMAIAGVLGTQALKDWTTGAAEVAKKAYLIADAMIAERQKGEPARAVKRDTSVISVKGER